MGIRIPFAARWLREALGDAPATTGGHVDALDGLRGLAVLIVIASHLGNAGIGLLPLPLGGTGKSGVYLFYVLSAFLLMRLMLLRGARDGYGNARMWADYALRRVLRIWPLYLFVLLLSWVLTTRGIGDWHFRIDSPALLRHLTLREGRSVLWSIPVEFKFYLCLPVLVISAAYLRGRVHWGVELALGSMLIAAVCLAWPAGQAPVNGIGLGYYLPVFLCGAYAARIDIALARGAHARAWAVAGVLAAAAFVATLPAVWGWATGSAVRPDLGHRWFLFFGVLWAVLLLAVLHGPAWLRQVFSSRPMRLVGVVSFSAYLWHMPVVEVAERYLPAHGAVAGWLALAGSLAVAATSWWWLERPWRRVRLRGG